MNLLRTYSELITLPTFAERFEYVKLHGKIGEETFGWERYLNQAFYHSIEWRNFRNYIITRDMGRDLASPDYEINGRIVIHHLNEMRVNDISSHNIEIILNPENVVCVSYTTHNAIHYGSEKMLDYQPVVRTPGDTCPWR